jgi:hypothetical protein
MKLFSLFAAAVRTLIAALLSGAHTCTSLQPL